LEAQLVGLSQRIRAGKGVKRAAVHAFAAAAGWAGQRAHYNAFSTTELILTMLARLTSVALLALVLIFQYQTWLGPRNRADLAQLRERLALVQKDNAEKVQINAQLQAEVDDLQNGLETVEEKARFELNMVKDGEILVQYLD